MHILYKACILAATLAVSMLSASTITVFGDGTAFTNPGPSNANNFSALDAWFSNNVRNSGASGITTNYPRSGNGSVYFQSPSGSAKADFEILFANAFLTPYTLQSLTALSYDWYRDSASTVAGHFMPALRLYFDADGNQATTNDRGYLVYERAYNPNTAPVPVDQWVSDDVFNFNSPGQSANMWMVHFGNPNGSVLEIYNRSLQDWLNTANPNNAYPSLGADTVIYGLSVGVGSGWTGNFIGAVDNVRVAFGQSIDTTWNFEVRDSAIPEPTTGVLLLGGLGVMWVSRRRFSN
jgi:hypothetical protein